MAFEFAPGTNGPVRLRESVVASDAPAPNELVEGELAINSADGKLFYRTAQGGVAQLGGEVSSVNGQTGAVTIIAGVSSVNGSTGSVSITPVSIGAASATHSHVPSDVGLPVIVVGAVTQVTGVSEANSLPTPIPGLSVTLPSGAWDVRVALRGDSASTADGNARVLFNGDTNSSSSYILYGGADIVNASQQAVSAGVDSVLTSQFIYSSSQGVTLAVGLYSNSAPDITQVRPGSHVICIRCGDAT